MNATNTAEQIIPLAFKLKVVDTVPVLAAKIPDEVDLLTITESVDATNPRMQGLAEMGLLKHCVKCIMLQTEITDGKPLLERTLLVRESTREVGLLCPMLHKLVQKGRVSCLNEVGCAGGVTLNLTIPDEDAARLSTSELPTEPLVCETVSGISQNASQ